jgi:hypothetical protein
MEKSMDFLLHDTNSCKKCMGFFARQKITSNSVWISSPIGKKHAKTAWVFSPIIKTHVKVYGLVIYAKST